MIDLHPKKLEDYKHDPVFVQFFKDLGIDILKIKTGYEDEYGEIVVDNSAE